MKVNCLKVLFVNGIQLLCGVANVLVVAGMHFLPIA